MNKVSANDFFHFIKENENAKRELIENLEEHDLFALEKSKQENIMLDVMIKLAKKYNFDVDKSDLKKYLNEGVAELDDDQLLGVAGGGLFPWGLLLLQIFSSGGPAITAPSPGEAVTTSADTSIVQTYSDAQDENILDFTDDSETVTDDSKDLIENKENKTDDSKTVSDNNENAAKNENSQKTETKATTDANESDSNTNSQSSQTAEPDNTKDTTEAEINFSLKLLEKLPQKGEAGFDDFLKITGVETLTDSKDVTIKHSNGTSETLNINEKEVYAQIENTVREIVQKVESRTPEENMSQEDIDLKINNKQISKHYRLPKQMRIAKAIYRWVAKNITYDFENIEGDPDTLPFAKPQNALFVFNQKSGICAGYASLTNLMMRMAGIPSACVTSIKGKDTNSSHAFNLIYLDGSTTNHKGWALLDSTWAAPQSDKNLKTTDMALERVDEKFLTLSNQVCIFPLYDYDSNDLSYSIYERLEEINASKDSTKMDRVEEYISELQAVSEGYIKKYSDNMVDNIDNINQEIQSELDKINPEYQDIVTFKEFEVFSETDEEIGITNFFISAVTSLTQDEAESVAKAQIEESQNNNNALSNIKMYFPGFYDDANKSLAEANKSIINQKFHKIRFITDTYFDKSYYTDMNEELKKIDGVKYELCGNEGNAYIKVSGDEGDPAENVQIPKDLVDLGLEFVIDDGIDSLTLTGDEIINTSDSAVYLENIDTTNSNKYIAEDGILYEKNTDGSKGTAVDLFKGAGDIENVHYVTKKNNNNKLIAIQIYNSKGKNFENVTVPEQLTQFNVPIEIGRGIKSVTLAGDETIDTSSAFSLENINADKSNKYIAEDGILYAKNADGSKGSALNLFDWFGNIDGIYYYADKDSSNKLISITIFPASNFALNIKKIPVQLTQFNVPIKIGNKITKLTLHGNEKIDATGAVDLKTIDITNSNVYYEANANLYKKDSNQKVFLPHGVTIVNNK